MGEIRMFAGTFAPKNWLLCDGQLLQIADFSVLYAILGTTYGGNGRTTFGLPDLRGRAPISSGHGHPGQYTKGMMWGFERIILRSQELPTHTHAATNSLNGNVIIPASSGGDAVNTAGPDSYFGTGGTMPEIFREGLENPVSMPPAAVSISGAINVEQAGHSTSHNNMQPFIALNFIICHTGLWPERSN